MPFFVIIFVHITGGRKPKNHGGVTHLGGVVKITGG